MTEVFVASAMATSYPWKLQKPSTVSPRVRETADSFIMDSGIGDDVSNREVIELATKYDADYVVAKDYLHDRDRTTKSVNEFMEIFPEYDCSATPLVPLQPPHHKHYRELEGFDHYVLGGMALDTVDSEQQLKWIKEFRRVAPDVYAHGLGVGGSLPFVRECAAGDYLDSVDCSTPEQAAMFGKVLDSDLSQRDVLAFPGGEGKSDRTHPLAAFNSWQVRDVWEREADREGEQTALGDVLEFG